MEEDNNVRTALKNTSIMCKISITYSNWSRHLQSKKHKRNDPNETIKPRFHKKTTLRIKNNIPTLKKREQ
ncbi:Hypothetical protein CINCED_3A006891 [Cinara cedri]|uniref:Uncharacterized protein n=1 Tax=Cinara cedri TaxID=506608 RepID=A0A5E4NSM1_9HEMI|nr:Hypothetical protein CINCED_3A006891 [Cinara cedri]